MNWLDVAIIGVMGISIFFGVRRGLIKEIFTLLALILGVAIASRSYATGARLLSGMIQSANAANIVSFIVIFLLVGALLTITGLLLKKLINQVALGWVDRVGGLVFGLMRGGIIVGVVLVFMYKYPVLGSDKWIKDAVLAPFFLYFIESLWRLIPPDLSGAVGV